MSNKVPASDLSFTPTDQWLAETECLKSSISVRAPGQTPQDFLFAKFERIVAIGRRFGDCSATLQLWSDRYAQVRAGKVEDDGTKEWLHKLGRQYFDADIEYVLYISALEATAPEFPAIHDQPLYYVESVPGVSFSVGGFGNTARGFEQAKRHADSVAAQAGKAVHVHYRLPHGVAVSVYVAQGTEAVLSKIS